MRIAHDVSYLELSESNGELTSRIGIKPMKELTLKLESAAQRAREEVIRVIDLRGETAHDHLQSALLTAFTSLHYTKHANPPLPHEGELTYHYVLLGTDSTARHMHGTSIKESLKALGGSAADDHLLVDFSGVAEARLFAIEELYRRVYGQPSGHAEQQPLEQRAAARRIKLASQWPTAAEVSRNLGSSAGNASHLATKHRRAGKLLGVYLPVPGGSWRFPQWQFQRDGQPVMHLEEILKVLHEQGPFLDTDRRSTGWGEVEWFQSGHVLLDGHTPAEVLATHPHRVLTAAKAEFSEEP